MNEQRQSVTEQLQKLNAFVADTNVDQFEIAPGQRGELILMGSDDLAYYHQVELVFASCSFVSLPWRFDEPRFRPATPEERRRCPIPPDEEDCVIAIETPDVDGVVFMVCAQDLWVTYGMSYHYRRANLAPGETVAPWVGDEPA